MAQGGMVDELIAFIREAVGLEKTPGSLPNLMRLGLYDATVDVCSADGATLDVTPLDKRLPPQKGVELRVGVPGAVATFQPNCVVMLGWDGGDPKKPYCVPHWKQGAVVTKLVLKATHVYLGDEAGAKKLATEDHTHSFTYNAGTAGSDTKTTDPPTTGL